MQHNVAQLTTRKLTCSEDEAWQLTALACKLNEAQGAYRGPAGTTLVFMTFGTVTLAGAADATLHTREHPAAGLDPVDAPDVLQFVHAYHAEQFAHDQVYHAAHTTDDDALTKMVDTKLAVYARYWRRDDTYWEPVSVGNPSEYEPARSSDWTVYRINDVRYRVAYNRDIGGLLQLPYAYDVQRFADGLRIIDATT